MSSKRPADWINPYAEQNAKIPGYRPYSDGSDVPNTPLPGLIKPACEWYAPLNVLLDMSHRATYTNENDGWIKVGRKHKQRRYRA